MILKADFKRYFADLNFSSIKLGDLNLPTYVQPPCCINTIVCYDLNDLEFRPFWWASDLPQFMLAFKIHSMHRGAVVKVIVERTTEIVETFNCTVENAIHSDETYLYYAFRLSQMLPKGLLRIDLHSYGYIAATTLVNNITYRDLVNGDYLCFNYVNRKSDIHDFPFKSAKDKLPAGGFAFCVEGGIRIGDSTFTVEHSVFRDQRYNPDVLSVYPRKTLTLSVGKPSGVSEHVGDAINNILSCDTVYLNGVRIARNGNNVPEPTAIAVNYPFVNYSVGVEIIPTEPGDFNVATSL